MAAEVVGGAFLSAFLEVVFDTLASPEVANFVHGKKLDKKLLQRLEDILRVVRVVLDDAEKKQITNSSVKDWLTSLKDVVYHADDLLDEVSTKAATQKKISTLFSSFSNSKMASKLEDIVARLESVLRLKESLDLKEIALENMSWKAPSTSLEDRSHIYGRNEDKEAIIKLLLQVVNDGEQVSVIPIVGMGGVGKTTLAQLVYNDDNLKQIFNLKAWICVSEEFDILKITKIMTESVMGKPCKLNDLNLLYLDLTNKLKDKKFLIVLDDVWIEDYDKWNLLKKPFQHGIRGSKILVTTRSEKVASVVHTVQAYHLKQLSSEACWSVFANHACFSTEHSEKAKTLEEIGKEIVKKCQGLPLAAQSLGGMLKKNNDIREWDNILNSDIWELPCNIIPALRISYHYLPPHLKRCFVYCSLYPKDYEFQKNELIMLWMAEDLLKTPKKGKTLEEVGYEYFDYLVSRSFFQRSSSGCNVFVMHDLMHDLATSLGGEFYLSSEELGSKTKIEKTRHLSFTEFSFSDNFEVFNTAKYLRTFLPFINFHVAPFSREKAACMIMSKLIYLRVLSFRDFKSLNALPDSIGELSHLRYLNLSGTRVKTLPESLCSLYNLQTLDLLGCHELTNFPGGMHKLVNLRHLFFDRFPIQQMPNRMRKLNHLQHLDYYIVGKQKENGIKELGGLPNLHGSLSIKNLENVTTSQEALEARIMDKKHISTLSLEWSECYKNSTDFQIGTDVLCKLKPHQDLKSMCIKGYPGNSFPDWVGSFLYKKMTHLTLENCYNCCMLPSLGQLPYLRHLFISRLYSVKSIDTSFYQTEDRPSVTPFPSLESLTINEMASWEVWSSFHTDAFPLLKDLEILRCPKFRGDLPNHLPSLEQLRIGGMPCWEVWISLERKASFPLLKHLNICDCSKLRGDLPDHLPALESTIIKNCEILASSLPRASTIRSLTLGRSNKVALNVFPLSVESITVEGSPMVESMIEVIANIQPTCLQSLKLIGCSSFISFPGGHIPASLKTLSILDLKKLEFPTDHKHELLESLKIWHSCDSLTSFPLITFPNLKHLSIDSCENLESLLVSVSEPPKNLISLVIQYCPNFVSFPREGLPAPNLNSFMVVKCVKLKSLPDQMGTLLPKLESLWIMDCPEIELFPEGDMPLNLRSVHISNCEKLLRCIAWPSMDKLTNLTLCGQCVGIKSFPKEALLPPSLQCLSLSDFSSLETLDCKGLLHLTSLQQLNIRSCYKLENMVGERLPASLIKLEMYHCPLLAKQCCKKQPQIWPKISHVCGICVDDTWI